MVFTATDLWKILKELSSTDRNIEITEDEFTVIDTFVCQMEVKEKTGLD